MRWIRVLCGGVGDGKRYLLISVSRSFSGSCTCLVISIRVQSDNTLIALKINESNYVKL